MIQPRAAQRLWHHNPIKAFDGRGIGRVGNRGSSAAGGDRAQHATNEVAQVVFELDLVGYTADCTPTNGRIGGSRADDLFPGMVVALGMALAPLKSTVGAMVMVVAGPTSLLPRPLAFFVPFCKIPVPKSSPMCPRDFATM